MERQSTQVTTKSVDDLLTRFRIARYRDRARTATNTSATVLFLDEYKAVSERIGAEQALQAVRQRAAFNQILDDYEAYWDQWQKTQRSGAERFNVLSVLGLEGRELCHSRVLAWLLDRDARWYGTHSQGSQGFEIFLERLGLPSAYAKGKYRVRTEVPGLHSRIDLEIAEPRNFVIHIENKIWSKEGLDQTKSEWEDLQRRARANCRSTAARTGPSRIF